MKNNLHMQVIVQKQRGDRYQEDIQNSKVQGQMTTPWQKDKVQNYQYIKKMKIEKYSLFKYK